MKMDLCDVRNIEFLDLTGVDENEQRRVRTSLQQNDPSVQLPWIKMEKNVFQEESTHGMKDHYPANPPESSSTSYKDYNHHAMMTPPILNNVFVSPNHHYSQSAVAIPHIMPTCVAPANVVYYANNIPPISPPYPQPVFIQGPTKVALIPNTIPSYPQAAPYAQSPQAYQVPTNSTNSQNGIPLVPPTVTNIATPAPVTKPILPSNQISSHPTTNNSLNDNTVDTQSVSMKSSANTTIVENGLKPMASPSLANKSWASLFSSKADGDATRSGTDAIDKAMYEQEGVNESNNNVPMCPIKHPRKSQFVDPDCYRMGEYLASYTVDGKAISLQPRGLLNQSNYCYVNSILQAIIACPPLYNLLCGLAQNISSNEKRKPTPVIDGMCRFVKEFKHLPANMRVSRRSEGGKTAKKDQGVLINTDIPFEPSWIYRMLIGIKTDLIEGRQEDAEEFLGCLLNGLNDEMLELIKLVKNCCDETQSPQNNDSELDKEWQVMGPKNKGTFSRRTEFGRTPISDIFGGFLKSRIHRAGDQITENIQPFFTLQLNIEKVNTVREALEALVTKYQLEGLTSSKTNEEVEAWQQVILDSLPVILILHLKCFDYKMDGCTKIVKALEFPIDLKIDSKLLSSKISNPKEKQYKLFAVVYHDGEEASKGHYVTDAFHVGYSSWLRYDDASVKSVQEDNVLKPQGTRVPYLLFYRRSDTIRSK